MVTLKQISPDPNINLMGLEAVGLSVFPGCSTNFEIPWVNGRPNIGLDAKEDKAKREKFESFFGVKFDTQEGKEFLSNYEISISHNATSFDPEKNPKHAFDLHVFKVNNGMGIVAVDESVFDNVAVNTFKFKISDDQRDIEEKVTRKQKTVKAIAKLSELFESQTNRLVLLAKYLYPAGSGITTKNLAFNKIEEYISSKVSNAEKFLESTKLEPEYIDTVVLVKEAIFRGVVRLGPDNRYILAMNGTILGRTEEEVIQYCLNPENADIVGLGSKDDKPYSLKAQITEK